MHVKLERQERRKYLRLNTTFPVQFRLLSPDSKAFLSGWLQGFTNDVGKGGICLHVHNLASPLAKILKDNLARLALDIELPVLRIPVRARASVAWIRPVPEVPNKYIIGLKYEHINKNDNGLIMRYAWAKKILTPIFVGLVLLLSLGLLLNLYANLRLKQANMAMSGRLMQVGRQAVAAQSRMKKIRAEIKDYKARMLRLEEQMQSSQLEAKDKELRIKKLDYERQALGSKLSQLESSEAQALDDLSRLDQMRASLERENLSKLYPWLAAHQNPQTGLIASFEGDDNLRDVAFTYDQALAAMAYTYSGDTYRAQGVFDFFARKARREGGFFLNAYYASNGEAEEYSAHTGPSTWIGIAIMQYMQKTQDAAYLSLAEEIAQELLTLQSADPDGGLRGASSGADWFSSEHNLDAYAFLKMLYKFSPRPEYLQASDRILTWLQKHTYSAKDIPVKRGKGDATIATDTYAWSIAAIGPEKLKALGLDPDAILDYAEQHCRVEVGFLRPEGLRVNIKGFDFAPLQHSSRGGVVSAEWTAQMAIAFKTMADFYRGRGADIQSRGYQLKAEEYLSELAKMVISSDSPSGQGAGCLPYATEDYVDTGHGWITPRGGSTGSVAATAYTFFAVNGFNPLELK